MLLRAAAGAHSISTEAEKSTAYCFSLLRLRYYYCCFLLSILLLLQLFRRYMHVHFLFEALLLPIIFLVSCSDPAAGACAATTSVLKQREVPATVSSFHLSILDTAILRTSIDDVVLGCFYFRPLDCDILVMVVDCAAV